VTTTHEHVQWTAGDDWQINATLVDENDVPFDLTSAEIKWALMDAAFKRALDESDANIVLTDALEGQCSIHIPSAKTSPLAEGRYNDVIRIVSGGVASTLAYGPIYVHADPWIAEKIVYATVVARQYKLRVA
jgi:hypothetical protein